MFLITPKDDSQPSQTILGSHCSGETVPAFIAQMYLWGCLPDFMLHSRTSFMTMLHSVSSTSINPWVNGMRASILRILLLMHGFALMCNILCVTWNARVLEPCVVGTIGNKQHLQYDYHNAPIELSASEVRSTFSATSTNQKMLSLVSMATLGMGNYKAYQKQLSFQVRSIKQLGWLGWSVQLKLHYE